MIDSDAHFCSPGPTSSAFHTTTHKKGRITHRQRARWTQNQECFKKDLISGAKIAALALPCVTLQTLCLWARPRFPEKSKKRTIDLWSHRWCEMVPDTHPPRSHGPMYGEKWSQHLPNIDTYPPTRIYRPGRSVTVDIDGRCRFTYGELRSIFDRRLKIEIILWSISSTIPVENWSKETPLPGGFSISCVPWSRTREEEDPPRSTWYKFFEGGPLPSGSWSGNIVNRKPPRGGGVSFDQNPCHFSDPEFEEVDFTLQFYGDTSTGPKCGKI